MSALRKLALCCCLPFGKPPVSRRNSRKPSVSKRISLAQDLDVDVNDDATPTRPRSRISSTTDVNINVNDVIPSDDVTDNPSPDQVPEKDKVSVTLIELLGDKDEIDAYELKEMLDQALVDYGTFSVDACRSMVALGDTDVSGKLGREEVHVLFQCIDEWQAAFHHVDSDIKGYIFGHEIDLVLERLEGGIKVSDKILRMMNNRYSDGEGHVSFIDLIQCLVRLSGMMGHYENRVNSSRSGIATFKMDEFMRLHMYS